MRTLRHILTLLALVALAFGQTPDTSPILGEDINLPLADGFIVVLNARFIHVNYGIYAPTLTMKLANRTSIAWESLKLQFDVGGWCNGEHRHWVLPVSTSLDSPPFVKEYSDSVIALVGKVDGCRTEVIRAKLISAEYFIRPFIRDSFGRAMTTSSPISINTTPIDMKEEALEVKARAAAEDKAQAEADRVRIESQQKRDAAKAALELQEAIAKHEQAVAEQEKIRKARVACTTIYKN